MTALVPFVVALCGAGLAYLWVYVEVWMAVALVAASIALGLILFRIGQGKVRQSPITGLKFMEWRFLFPGSTAAAGSGAVIIVAATLAEQDSWSDEAKGLIGAISGAIGVFISTLFVDSAKEADSAWLATPIRETFEREFKGVFREGSTADLAVYSLQGGWGRTDRRERAEKIEKALPSK